MAAVADIEPDDPRDDLHSNKRTTVNPRFRDVPRSIMSPWFKSPYTPRRGLIKLATPLSRRLIPKLRTASMSADDEHQFEGLLKKQWRTYSLSPLFNFKPHRAVLVKYERSLDAALSQAQSTSADILNSGAEKSHFSFYNGLKFNSDDPAALRIQVWEKNATGHESKIVLEAFLLCVELSMSPIPAELKAYFTYYPVVLVAGNKSKTTVLFDWLEHHFDCRSDLLTLTDADLRHLLAHCSAFMSGNKSPPVLMQYSLEDKCEGIQYINCKLEAHYCKQLWERLFSSPSTKRELFQSDVDSFVDHLEQLLEHLMSIVFKKLSLSEVGTSAAYISHAGKIKLFSSSVVYTALHVLCDIANDRYLEMAPRDQ
ncbi:centromere protein l [Plakobranchus ocellatus]|uniref:Centromere protein L n=1 Tax=Plakobranchus ocellatus TaxID=259542 RepID=A0AAV4DTX1_9GAST|nr:centromere protein l [Plakobranchus ocellatus]